jgi:hypothetical protein
MSQELTQYQKLVECLKHHLSYVWGELYPTNEELNDDEYIQGTLINNAVNNDIYDFYELWNDPTNPDYFEMKADTILRLLNEVKDWHRNEMGDEWLPPNNEYSIQTIMNGWASMEVENWGIGAVRAIIVDLLEEEDEAVEEEYNGTKDFPPNETDDNCPICLEAYTSQKMKDGIRCSDIPSNCSHYCCERCWYVIWGQQNDTNNCPICKRDITMWLSTHYPNQAIKDFLKTLPPK